MDLSAALPAFVLAVVLISASPGPATALILRPAAPHGTRAAVPTVLGLEVGLSLRALAAGAGPGSSRRRLGRRLHRPARRRGLGAAPARCRGMAHSRRCAGASARGGRRTGAAVPPGLVRPGRGRAARHAIGRGPAVRVLPGVRAGRRPGAGVDGRPRAAAGRHRDPAVLGAGSRGRTCDRVVPPLPGPASPRAGERERPDRSGPAGRRHVPLGPPAREPGQGRVCRSVRGGAARGRVLVRRTPVSARVPEPA